MSDESKRNEMRKCFQYGACLDEIRGYSKCSILATLEKSNMSCLLHFNLPVRFVFHSSRNTSIINLLFISQSNSFLMYTHPSTHKPSIDKEYPISSWANKHLFLWTTLENQFQIKILKNNNTLKLNLFLWTISKVILRIFATIDSIDACN